MQYYFTGDEHVIIKPQHGNSKGSSPYKRTKPSTMARLKEVCQNLSPVGTMELIDEEVGDIIGQSSSGSRLRNLSQVYNARKKLKLDDNLANTVSMSRN